MDQKVRDKDKWESTNHVTKLSKQPRPLLHSTESGRLLQQCPFPALNHTC